MQKIKLFKKYADGKVRGVEVNDTPANVQHMFKNGFFLTEKEAKDGKLAPKPKAKPKAKAKPKPKKAG